MNILQRLISAIRYLFGYRKSSLEELAVVLDKKAAANPEKLDWRNSIVDLLKLTGQDSSLAARKAMAKELGYQGAYGSADMNIWLHRQVMQKLR